MKPKKILLAEDDADDREFFINYFVERSDVEMLPIAENGAELVKQLDETSTKENLPDIIILDQNMPRLNGLQTLQQLKSLDRFKHIPVVVYSTYVNQQLQSDCKQFGAVGVFTKPSSKKEYDKMIDDLLDD